MSYNEKRLQVDELQQRLNDHGELSAEVKKKINYKFRLDWNYYSNSMEGNTLTMEETRSVMVGNITVGGKPIKDILEVKGHDEIISDILKIGKGEVRLSEKRIKDIHKGIMYEEDDSKKPKIGAWKTEPNYVVNYKGERFDFVVPADVPERMHDLLNKTNAAIDAIHDNKKDAPHPMDVAFQFHLDFVLIHPFYDGNGRTARILTNLLLISFGYPPFWVNTNERGIYNQYIADIQGYGGNADLFFDFSAGLILRSQLLVLDAIDGKPIEEPEDLDKKLELLKAKLGEERDAIIKLTLGNEAINKVIKQTLSPLAFAWEKRLKKFDALFISRKVHLLADDSIFRMKAFDGEFEKICRDFLTSKQATTVRKFILRCDARGLRNVNNSVSLNAGELYVELFQNAFEVYSSVSDRRINKLYHQTLSQKEIDQLVGEVGNFLYNNIEHFIEANKS